MNLHHVNPHHDMADEADETDKPDEASCTSASADVRFLRPITT